MKVILLGAGASKSYIESPTEIQMPIAKDFFNAFYKLPIASNPWVLVDDIINFLYEYKNIPPSDAINYLISGVSIEELHSEIGEVRDNFLEQKIFLPEISTSYNAYNQLLFLFASVLNEIQNGPISLAHKHLASVLSTDDAIITFNWDTLMDRALYSVTNWCVDTGYGVRPHYIYRNKWQRAKQRKLKAPVMIKLHGSTNWLTSHVIIGKDGIEHTHDTDPSELNIFECSSKPYHCYQGRYMRGFQPFSYGYYPPNLNIRGKKAPKDWSILSLYPKFPSLKEGTKLDEGLISMPLMIPPVKSKKYEQFGTLFKSLWMRAEDYLCNAEKIIIIGYSFPPTDLQSSQLFIQAFMRRKDVPKIIIIDPFPENIVNKFVFDFGISFTNITIVKECFSADMNLSPYIC